MTARRGIESLSRLLLGTLDARELTRLIVREAGKLVGADGVALASLADGGVLVVSSLSNGMLAALAGQTLPLDSSLAGWCLRTGEPVRARDVACDPRAFSAAVAATGVRHLVVAPLAVGGERFGVLFAGRSGRAPFRARDLARWTRLAEKAALALSNARLYERAVARRRSFEELHEFAATVVGELDRQTVFDAVTQRAARMLGTDAASFVVSDGADVVYQSRFGPESFAPGFRLLAEDTIAGQVVREGRSVRISDISRDERYNPDRMLTGTQAVLAVPVWVEGVVLGSLGVLQYAARQFTDDDEEILRQLAGMAASVLRQIANLTERRKIEQRAVVGEKLATLGRLVAGAAHEINNPLAAVLAHAQLALETAAPEGPVRPTLEVIVTEARRAGRIVKGMLSFARQRPLAARVFDLKACVADVLQLRRGYHDSAGIEVVTEGDSEAAVLGDADQLTQVLLNLVVNAEHALRGATTRRLRIAVESPGTLRRVVVEDSGPGVPDELRQRLFEPFFTTKPEGEGSGLGLSVSYGIVKEHGGELWHETPAGGGARFVVDLPGSLAAVRGDTLQPAAPPAAIRAASAQRVLLVDDEEALRSIGQRVLRRVGHTVDVAADGRAALALLDAAPYDVVLCDVRMPNLTGPELFAELERRGALHRMRFVATTGDIADADTQAFLERSGVPVLLKPFELTGLLEAVAG